jgi:hypothetical protein
MAMLDKRGKNGRFLPGHGGGPGNPHAQKVHRLRAALLNAVTPADIEEIVRKLIAMAKQGEIAAIKELLDRTLGKPVAAVELSGADGEPLLQLGRLQEAILQALAEFPEARVAIARRLRELVDDRSPESTDAAVDPARPGDADGNDRPGA